MEQKFYIIFRKSIAARLLLLVSLLVGGGDSVWGDEVTVYETETNSYFNVPIAGTKLGSNFVKSEFIIPASELEALSGMQIDGIKFHIKTASSNSWGDARFKVFLKEVDYTTFESITFSNLENEEIVYEGALDATSSTMTITFSSPFYYDGLKNLLVGIHCTSKGTASTGDVNYWGFNSVDNSSIFYTTYSGSNKFVPRTTFVYSDASTYKKPKGLSVLNLTSSSATFSWANGNDEEAWQLVYSTNENFDPNSAHPIDINSKPYTLNRLEEGTTYYAYVRANYSGEFSDWSNKVEFTPLINPTINDGATSNNNTPIFGFKIDHETMGQVIIPKSQLESLVDRNITKLTFYSVQSSINWGDARFDIYLLETDETGYNSTPVFKDWGTKVCNAVPLSVSDNKMVIDFNINPFHYSGNNLMIGIKLTTTGTAKTSSWYGTSGSNNAAYYYYSYHNSTTDQDVYVTSRNSWYPKITFSTELLPNVSTTIGSTGFTTFSSSKALNLDELPDGLKAFYIASSGINASSVTLTEATGTISAGTGLILKGTANQQYEIPIANSGSELSGNLLIGCVTPQDIAASASKYVLVNNGGTAEFQSLEDNGATIPAGKAYLNTAGAGARLSILFDDNDNTATSIKTAKTIDKTNIIYNLMGQKVKGSKPGLYIKNGKKVVKK